jgi:hypothetical protein
MHFVSKIHKNLSGFSNIMPFTIHPKNSPPRIGIADKARIEMYKVQLNPISPTTGYAQGESPERKI